MTIVLQNYSPETTKYGIFGPKIKIVLFLWKIQQFDKFESDGFKYGVVFKTAAQKH